MDNYCDKVRHDVTAVRGRGGGAGVGRGGVVGQRIPRARICKRLRSPGIEFQGFDFASLCSLAGRYDNPIPTRFLTLIDYTKIPAPLRNIG
jgi:hypothetical protein